MKLNPSNSHLIAVISRTRLGLLRNHQQPKTIRFLYLRAATASSCWFSLASIVTKSLLSDGCCTTSLRSQCNLPTESPARRSRDLPASSHQSSFRMGGRIPCTGSTCADDPALGESSGTRVGAAKQPYRAVHSGDPLSEESRISDRVDSDRAVSTSYPQSEALARGVKELSRGIPGQPKPRVSPCMESQTDLLIVERVIGHYNAVQADEFEC